VTDRPSWLEAALTVVVLVAIMLSFARFAAWVDLRPGVVLSDPLLARFAPRDVTWPIFSVLYGGIALAVALLRKHPARLLAGCQAYGLMVLLRIVMMWAAPFDAPADALALADPFVRAFGPSQILTRDLFFSGHTATSTMLALAAPRRWARRLLALGVVSLATCVLVQHVHYTIDVLVAPFVSFGAWRLTLYARARLGLPSVSMGEERAERDGSG
jgi:hypothetical protein